MTAPANSVQTLRGRMYRWRGEQFWSVTTILGALAKPALVPWAARTVAEYAVENADTLNALLAKEDREGAVRWLKGEAFERRDRAADLGSAVHAAAEAYAKGLPIPEGPPEVTPYIRQFERFCEDFDPAYSEREIEVTVYNRKHGYAGTLDAIADIDGRLFLLDTKSGKDVYPEAAMQMAAYRFAEFIGQGGEERPVPAIEACAVLHLTPERYRLVPVKADYETFRCFLAAHFLFTQWIEGIARECIEPTLEPVRRAA